MSIRNSIWRAVWRVLGSACLVMASAFADTPFEPVLRIDPGEHVATIRAIATDQAGRWLVTASDDKTARIWDLADGKLLTTLRAPTADPALGRFYAAAMSPDGQTVALGGWLAAVGGSESIQLFDRASGRPLRRLGGFSEIVIHLAISSDGRYLAAGLGGKQGVRVFALADGRLVGEDSQFDGPSYGIEFSRDGRIVATGADGYVRLYRLENEQLKLLAKQALPGGKEPVHARFSPDGKRIAVGFGDTGAVNLLDAADLRLLAAPDTKDLGTGCFGIAWSADGTTLYAAGRFNRELRHFIRRWLVQGNTFGAAQDWMVAGNTIQDLAALPDGRLAFADSGPQWGVVDAGGKRLLDHGPAVADLRGMLKGFSVSPDGSRVRFGYEYGGKSAAVFYTLARRMLSADTSGLQEPEFSAKGLDIRDWYSARNPTLNGAPITLSAREIARSLAVQPNGEGFVLGADWTLRSFARDGSLRWAWRTPESVWGVNLTRNGRWVVAAYGDGTIRWHRASDGVEQMAFYPHPDRQRWVLWTPSGYYDASPGAEDLIGWYVGRGSEQGGDFFPASRFRSQFYRPDVLAKVLETADEKQAVEAANAEAGRRPQAPSLAQSLPPVVEILSPGDGTAVRSGSLVVRYAVRSAADAPVTGLRVRVNGQAVTPDAARNLAVGAGGDTREIVVPIPPQDSEIQLFAENRNGVSTPAAVRVAWAEKQPVVAEDASYKPKLYVLAVGVSKYANPAYNLGLAAKDARDIAAVFQQQKGRLYADVKVRLLVDAKATRDEVVDGLEWLKREVTAHDVGVMFLAGHGLNDNTGKYYFMPHNADPTRLLRTGVSQSDIKDTLNSLAGKAMFFVDTCHSGNAIGTAQTRGIGGEIDAFVNELASAENGVVVFTAATGRQLSREDEAWGNGAFTKAVVEGLSGKADFQKTGRITHKGLDYYVAERVKQLTQGQQSPVSITPRGVPDFPIAVVR